MVKLNTLGCPAGAALVAVGIYNGLPLPAPTALHLPKALGVLGSVPYRRRPMPLTICSRPATGRCAVAAQAFVADTLGVACVTPEGPRRGGQSPLAGAAPTGRVDGVAHSSTTRPPCASSLTRHGHAVRAWHAPQASPLGSVAKQASHRSRRVTAHHHHWREGSGLRPSGPAGRTRLHPVKRGGRGRGPAPKQAAARSHEAMRPSARGRC